MMRVIDHAVGSTWVYNLFFMPTIFWTLKELVMEYLPDLDNEHDALGLSSKVRKLQSLSISTFLSPSNLELFEFSWQGFSSKSVMVVWLPCCLDVYYFGFHHSCQGTVVYHAISSTSPLYDLVLLQWMYAYYSFESSK